MCVPAINVFMDSNLQLAIVSLNYYTYIYMHTILTYVIIIQYICMYIRTNIITYVATLYIL